MCLVPPGLSCPNSLRVAVDRSQTLNYWKVAACLFFNYFLVYLSSGNVMIPGEGDVEISFVVSQIQIDFASIV